MKRLVIWSSVIGGVVGLVLGAVTLLSPPNTTYAGQQDPCRLNPNSSLCQARDASAESVINSVVNILLWVVGITSLIGIIAGGIMTVSSTGEASKVAKARFMILFSVVGLVVSIMAYVIVRFVIGAF